MPPAASGPVLTVNRPIFIGAFWALAGIGSDAVPAAAAVPARNLRRFIYGIAFSPITPRLVMVAAILRPTSGGAQRAVARLRWPNPPRLRGRHSGVTLRHAA